MQARRGPASRSIIQTSFDFTPGLTVQFRYLREVFCAVVYNSRGGLKAVAADCDLSPSELSRMLNRDQDDPSNLDVDVAMKIVASTGDTRPIQWQIEKFLHDPEERKATAAMQLAQILPAIVELAKQAGVTTTKRAR